MFQRVVTWVARSRLRMVRPGSFVALALLLHEEDLATDCAANVSFVHPFIFSTKGMRISPRTDWIVFHHAQRPVRARAHEGAVVARHGH